MPSDPRDRYRKLAMQAIDPAATEGERHNACSAMVRLVAQHPDVDFRAALAGATGGGPTDAPWWAQILKDMVSDLAPEVARSVARGRAEGSRGRKARKSMEV